MDRQSPRIGRIERPCDLCRRPIVTALHEAAIGQKNDAANWVTPPNIRVIDLWIKHREIGLNNPKSDDSKPLRRAAAGTGR